MALGGNEVILSLLHRLDCLLARLLRLFFAFDVRSKYLYNSGILGSHLLMTRCERFARPSGRFGISLSVLSRSDNAGLATRHSDGRGLWPPGRYCTLAPWYLHLGR
ncbi:hypothetical protein VFPPC_15532 [Pochonia chlamydosporia 170]|uniref:Uncharacterized protein n=1 Tax=Pochonia chlamydosporia 170 TaxID=1380566 RepID=A0A179FYH1_METCM|nr:hypothetical protein VFPPC_15532 [Pochonia chlamydosporia 170]OAQ70093.1 hypothetical protein VFPPC_15532 [Pochonia chlamydosporia 170]